MLPTAITSLLCLTAIVHVIDCTDAARYHLAITARGALGRLLSVLRSYRISVAVEPRSKRDRSRLPRVAVSLSLSGVSATIGRHISIDTRCPAWRRKVAARVDSVVAASNARGAAAMSVALVWGMPFVFLACSG